MKIREVIQELSKCDMDSEFVMPSIDGSGIYIPVESIEQNYYITRNGELWFPDGDTDTLGNTHTFNKRVKAPIGAIKAVVVWETPKAKTKLVETKAPIVKAKPSAKRRFKLPRFHGGFTMLFRLVLLFAICYIAWPHHEYIFTHIWAAMVLTAFSVITLCGKING